MTLSPNSPMLAGSLKDSKRSLQPSALQHTTSSYAAREGDAGRLRCCTPQGSGDRLCLSGVSSRKVLGVARGPFDLVWSLACRDCLIQVLSVHRGAIHRGAARVAEPGLEPTTTGYGMRSWNRGHWRLFLCTRGAPHSEMHARMPSMARSKTRIDQVREDPMREAPWASRGLCWPPKRHTSRQSPRVGPNTPTYCQFDSPRAESRAIG
jgi:hypothetical protein